METVYYIYPMFNDVSFKFISQQHIRYLRQLLHKRVRLIEADIDTFNPQYWGFNRKVILHPIFYPFIQGRNSESLVKINRLKICLNKSYRMVAFDTADSDRISDKAVDLVNMTEAIFVPSNFVKEVYIRSGVLKPVYVIPHGIPEEFITKNKEITHPDLKNLSYMKEKKDLVFVHFNLTHSGYRKGADLFAKAMKIVQREKPNVIVLLKRLKNEDPYLNYIRMLKCIEISGYLDLDSYRQLYDISDVTVLTSRGGGFEHIALESISRGVPTIVPNDGCFIDYIKYAIPVDVTDTKPVVLENNPIHVGSGWEINVESLARTIIKVTDKLDKYKKVAWRKAKVIWKKYSWKNIVKKIVSILEDIDYLE